MTNLHNKGAEPMILCRAIVKLNEVNIAINVPNSTKSSNYIIRGTEAGVKGQADCVTRLHRRVYREEPFQRRRHLCDLTERPLSKPDDIN